MPCGSDRHANLQRELPVRRPMPSSSLHARHGRNFDDMRQLRHASPRVQRGRIGFHQSGLVHRPRRMPADVDASLPIGSKRHRDLRLDVQVGRQQMRDAGLHTRRARSVDAVRQLRHSATRVQCGRHCDHQHGRVHRPRRLRAGYDRGLPDGSNRQANLRQNLQVRRSVRGTGLHTRRAR